MADKPILTVDVDDSKLQELIEKYKKFSETAKDSPIEIKVSGSAEAVGRTVSKFEELTTNFDKLLKRLEDSKLSARNTGLIDRMGLRSKEMGTAFRGIERSVQVIERSFSNILRGGIGLTAFGGGLLGAATGFGASLFAGSVLSTKDLAGQVRQANALGLPAGEGKAFKDVYGSHIEGADESMLAKIAAMQGDSRTWKPFLALGIGQQEIQSQDAAHLAAEVLQRSGQKYQQLGPQYGGFAESSELKNLVDVNQARAAANPQLDWGTMAHDFEKVSAQMALTEAEQKKALDMQQRFDAAMDRIKQKLETVFLDKLAPYFEQFADQVADFVDSGQFEQIVKEGAHVVEEFVEISKKTIDFIAALAQSPELAADIEFVSRAFERLAEAIGKLWEFMKPFLARSGSDEAQVGEGLVDAINAWIHGDKKKALEIINKPLPDQSGDWMSDIKFGGNAGTAKDFIPDPNKAADFKAFEQKYGLKPGTLTISEQLESSGGHGGMVSTAGAVGPFQFMKKTADAYGLQNRWDEKASAESAAHYMADMIKRYHGNYDEAYAAYNTDPKNVDWAIEQGAKYHRDWRYYLPDETENYVRKAAQYSQGLKGEDATYTGTVKAPQGNGNNHGAMAPIKCDINVSCPPGYDANVSVNGLPQ